jgi:hypothetical protein
MLLLAVLLSLLPYNSADAQLFSCPPGSWAVQGGGGKMCQCPDGTFASISGCKTTYVAPQPPASSWPPEQYQAPTTGIESNPIVKAFEDLGSLEKQGENNVTKLGTLSDQLTSTPPPPPNHAAQVAVGEILGQSGPTMPQIAPPRTTPDFTPLPPAPSPPKSTTCDNYRDPNCFVPLKPSE